MFNKQPARSWLNRVNTAIVISVVSASTVTAEDEIIEIDPDRTLLGNLLEFLRVAWNTLNEFLF